MTNPHDAVRDALLRFLYAKHRKAKSPKSAAAMIRDVQKAMRDEHGFKQQEVASNLDYLIQKGWVREVIENRTFTTARGTTQQAERRTYKISDVGIDRLEAASTYQRPAAHQVNITNVKGVTVVGDGNVVNTNFTDLARMLEEIRMAVAQSPRVEDQAKLDLAADIDSLQGQLQKPAPSKDVVRKLWTGIANTVTAAGFVDLITKAAGMIAPLLR